jgi:hypothetical protein
MVQIGSDASARLPGSILVLFAVTARYLRRAMFSLVWSAIEGGESIADARSKGLAADGLWDALCDAGSLRLRLLGPQMTPAVRRT